MSKWSMQGSGYLSGDLVSEPMRSCSGRLCSGYLCSGCLCSGIVRLGGLVYCVVVWESASSGLPKLWLCHNVWSGILLDCKYGVTFSQSAKKNVAPDVVHVALIDKLQHSCD